jgi:hypothetical protein
LQALINKDRAFARFLPTNPFAPSYMCQGKSSIVAGSLRQPRPAAFGLRRRVLKERVMAMGKRAVDLQQIDPPGIGMAVN